MSLIMIAVTSAADEHSCITNRTIGTRTEDISSVDARCF